MTNRDEMTSTLSTRAAALAEQIEAFHAEADKIEKDIRDGGYRITRGQGSQAIRDAVAAFQLIARHLHTPPPRD